MCQRGCWALKGVDCEILHRLERGTSVSVDAGSQMEVDCGIPRRLDRGTSASKNARIPHRLDSKNETFFYKDMKTSP